jgi:sugar phosphate isomerase/epimerase
MRRKNRNRSKKKYLSMIKNAVLCFLILISISSCGIRNHISSVAPKNNPFFVYNFGGIDKYTPKEQVALLQRIGYDGISIQVTTPQHVEGLKEFISISQKEKNFKIFSVFVRYNFQDSEVNKKRWKDVVEIIEGKDIALWFIFGKKQPEITADSVENILRTVVDYATEKQVPVTLYPHSTCYFASAEQALPLVKKINSPNLKLAVHLCHEMRAGNTNRMDEVVRNVAPFIGFVTLAGADKEVNMKNAYTMDKSTIKPLDEGEYDLSTFLKALKDIDYKGPVGFINFKIDENKPPEEYLPSSLNTWKLLKKMYLNY